MKTQFDKEYIITLIREIYPQNIDKISMEEKERKVELVRKSISQFGIDGPLEILSFYNDKDFRKQRKSRIGEKLYRKLMKIEFKALPFFFPEMDGMILKDSDLEKISYDATEIINWAGISRFLSSDRTAVSQNRIPLKYQQKVDRLIELIEQWQNENDLSSNGG